MNLIKSSFNWFKELLYSYNIEDLVLNFGLDLLNAILLITVMIIIRRIGKKTIIKIFEVKIDRIQHLESDAIKRRKETLKSLTLNIWRYAINIIGIFAVIGVFFDIGSIVASAGFVTVAVTFAAKSILADITMGFFIVFEDLFSVGDLIEVSGHTGTVKEIGLRSTKLQVITGEMIIIPNGSINQITNHSVSNGKAVLDVSIAYEADLEKAIETLEEICDCAMNNYPQIIERPIVLGVQQLGGCEVIVRVLAEVEPLQKWHIERELRKLIKLTFDRKGIEMPFPRMVIYQREEKGGINND